MAKRKAVNHTAISIQVHLRGPKGLPDAEVKRIYREFLASGTLASGWSVAWIEWQHQGSKGFAQTPGEIADAHKRLRAVIEAAGT